MVHILSMRSPIYRVDIVLASHLSARVIVIAYLNVKVVAEPDVVRNAVEAFEIICSDFKGWAKTIKTGEKCYLLWCGPSSQRIALPLEHAL